MRHHNTIKKFGRQTGQRNALLRSLIVSFIEHEKITTTEAKAKSLRSTIEKMVTRARNAGPADIRLLQSRLNNNTKTVNKLVKEIAPRYKDRNGGYTRITKLSMRGSRGDASPMAVIEFI